MKKAIDRIRWALMACLSVLMALLMILSVALPVFGNASRANAADSPEGVDVVEKDGVKKYVINETVRITPLSETVVRLEEKGAEGFEDRETFYVIGRDEFTAPQSECTASGTEVLITAGAYRVHVPKEATDLNGAYVTGLKDNVTLYRYNGVSLPNTYLPSPSEDIRGWYFSDNPRIVPGENGYSVMENYVELNGWDFDNKAPDVYVFVPENYTQFCEDYVTLTGKSNLIDLKTFGFWDSRWYVYNDEMALQQIQDYLDRGYSIDMLTIDTNWRKGTVNQTPGMDPSVGGMGYDIDTNLFPDMEAFLQRAHEMGVNIIFNDHPEPTPGNKNGLEKDEVEYRSTKLKVILSLGLDMWWYDRNWHTALNSADPDLSVFAWGMYAFQFIENEYYEELVAENKLEEFARRAIIMGNVDGCINGVWKYASDLSAHKYTIQWTGDINVDEHALDMEIRNAIFGGAENGIPYVSADLGGHTAAVTDDIYTRWLQYGALSTITRVHCTHEVYCHQEGRMPWLFGETAENVTKEYVGMKYNLMPTYYSLAGQNAQTGLPIMRRLDIAYPQYAEASRNDEYLLGDGILIAPINEGYTAKSFEKGFFHYTEGGEERNGLRGSYYNNVNFNGDPAYRRTDTEFLFDWGQSGPAGLPTDNFGVIWEGKFTVGEDDTRLTFFADDKVRVTIDGDVVVNSEAGGTNQYDVLFKTDYFAAGTTHSIEIRYVEEGNYAHFYMYGETKTPKGSSYCYNSREVFLPDGTWIDVWSGKEYEGPYTYTVTHPLETSPIFVRKGTLNVLAPDMSNLSEKDWSELTLDAYPSASKAETSLYEDDTVTQAYKYGNYRTTAISAEAVGGKYTIKIGAAKGTFEGAKAFTERKWNIRLHVFEELGDVKSVTVNGKSVYGWSYYTRDSLASPFSFTGASADTAVYMFSFSGKVEDETTIVVEFTDNTKLATFAKNAAYDATPAEFSVGGAKEVDGYLDLDNEAYDDWAFFGNLTARKGGAEHVIGELASDFEFFSNETSAACASWTNGEGVESGDNVPNSVRNQVEVNVALKVKAGEPKTFTLFLISEQCVGKLTVRDRAGNVRTVYLDDRAEGIASDSDVNNNFNGWSARMVTITVSAEKDTEIYVRYSVHSSRKEGGAGTGSDARVGISAIVYGDAEAELRKLPSVGQTELDQADAPDTANLSELPSDIMSGDVLDWLKTNEGTGFVYKEGGEVIGNLSGASYNPFYDYKTVISWSDGEAVTSSAGTQKGYHTDSNGNFTLNFHIDQNTQYIVLYVGAWKGTATVTLCDYMGRNRGSTAFSAGESSVCKRVVIPITGVSEETDITVRIVSSLSDGGNASLSAVQVIGKAN